VRLLPGPSGSVRRSRNIHQSAENRFSTPNDGRLNRIEARTYVRRRESRRSSRADWARPRGQNAYLPSRPARSSATEARNRGGPIRRRLWSGGVSQGGGTPLALFTPALVLNKRLPGRIALLSGSAAKEWPPNRRYSVWEAPFAGTMRRREETMHPRNSCAGLSGLDPGQIRFLSGLDPLTNAGATSLPAVYPLVRLGLVEFCLSRPGEATADCYRLTQKGRRLVKRLKQPAVFGQFRA